LTVILSPDFIFRKFSIPLLTLAKVLTGLMGWDFPKKMQKPGPSGQ
jgi:hypothetical protein